MKGASLRTSNKIPCIKGDVHVNHGQSGGVISTTIVTDDRAQGHPCEDGAECRGATQAEIEQAQRESRVHHITY